MRILKAFTIALVLLALTLQDTAARAQEAGAYYIVEAGDSLWQIAGRFGVSLQDLQQANDIQDATWVEVGTRLLIPGLQDVSGQVNTISIGYGDTLQSLSSRYHIAPLILARINKIISPTQLYVGSQMIVPIAENSMPPYDTRARLDPAQSLLEFAVIHGEDPWSIAANNFLEGTWSILPREGLQVSNTSPRQQPTELPDFSTRVQIDPLQGIQGGTAVVKIQAPAGLEIQGSLGPYTLTFFPQEYGYVTLQGISALTEPGLYPLSITEIVPGKTAVTVSQNILIQDAGFPFDPSLDVDPETVDPAVAEPEKQMWEALAVPVTSNKMWNGQFATPVPIEFKECWTSLFGNRRSYNNSPYSSFHSGLDFCGQIGTELYAVAPGNVVYTNFLTVRGGVVVIDHGWGVYTAYDHLSQILARPGDMVSTGQVIGLGGDTGRTTGPHLHWEVWVGGVQVNPADWLARSYP